MKVVDYENIYTYCSVNIGYHLLDLNGDIICYGSSASIVLYSLKAQKVVNVLRGHSNEINSARYFGTNGEYIVSSSSDMSAIVWSKIKDNHYEIKFVMKHSNSVSIAEAIVFNDKIYVLTFTRDKVFRVWLDGEIIFEMQSKHFTFDIKAYTDLCLFSGLIILQAGSEGIIYFQRFDIETKELKNLTFFCGHTDWIRTIDLHQNINDRTLSIASGAQDFSARVYSIFEYDKDNHNDKGLHKPTFIDGKQDYITECVTILYTHDLWINSVKWYIKNDGVLFLLTASSDRTIILWQEIEANGEYSSSKVWQEMARFGEFGGVQMGFNGCVVDSQRNLVIGYNYLGAIEVWKKKKSTCDFEHTISVTGHFENVTDLVWESKGEYFLTCSEDRTTRLHSALKNANSWHEITRIQVHGHALKCLAFAGPVKLISGGEEKVIRVFNGTKYFVQSLKNISGIDLLQNRFLNDSDMAEYATIPALGLSNSAVYRIQEQKQSGQDEKQSMGLKNDNESSRQQTFIPKVLDRPPIEETLGQNTLWPEIRKLYGHGFEIFSLSVNSKGTLLASACRAQSLKHAFIIVWNLDNYEILLKLDAHNLTITQLKFSPDDHYLLSVSRDRTWYLFNMEKDKEEFGKRIAFFNSKTGGHNRIIWDAAWTLDSKKFITVARDQKAIVWMLHDDLTVRSCDKVLTLEDSIKSVDILGSSNLNSKTFVAAFGLENGTIQIYEFCNENGWNLLSLLENSRHTAAINRLRFSPKIYETDGFVKKAFLASCGVDKTVKLIEIKFEKK